MKKILILALCIVSLSVMSCSKTDEASASNDVNINYVIVSTNASRSLWEYKDLNGTILKGSLIGSVTKTINQNFHKPSTAYIKLKSLQNNINTNVSVAAYIINIGNGDTLAKSSLSMLTDSVEVSVTKLLN